MKCLICETADLETGRVCTRCGRIEDRRLREIEWAWILLPLAVQPGSAAGPRVSGSREAPLPVRVDPLDLTMPARVPHVIGELIPATTTETVKVERRRVAVTEWARRDLKTDRIVETGHHIVYLREEVTGQVRVPLRWPSDGRRRVTPTDDQAGQLAVATVLDEWIHEWRWHRNAGEGLPPTGVQTMIAWLRNRLQWALDHLPGLLAYSDGIRALHGALRAAIGDLPPAPEPCPGVPCKRCDRMALVHTADGSGDVECGACGRLLDAEEYDRWVRLVAANPRTKAETAA